MLNSIIQGIIQGLTEFLPVSSSGHLALFQYFSGSNDLEANMLMSVALHVGTLIAVVYYFRNDIKPFFTVSGWKIESNRKLAGRVILASIPTAAIGLGLKNLMETLTHPAIVASGLFLTGLMLLISEKLKKGPQKDETKTDITEMSKTKAFLIGIAQGIAVAPGISRSGSTITAGLLANLKGEESAKFSFLLMIPAVGGAALLECRHIFEPGFAETFNVPALIAGVITAAITGFLSLKFLVYIIKKQKLSIFSYYLFVASIATFIAVYLK